MGRTPLDTPERQQEVFEAVLAVLAEVGYARFNMDLVAARARAGKASLYQRWPSKAKLIVDALKAKRPDAPQPDLGSFSEDVRAIMRSWGDPFRCDTPGIFLGLLEGSRHDAELERLRREHVDEAYRGPIMIALQRAVERGEVTPEVDGELVATSLIWNFVILSDRGGIVDRIVDGLLVPLLK